MAAAPMRGCVHDRRCKRVDVGTILDCRFRNGALLAAGIIFLTQGVLRASRSTDSYAREGSLPLNGYLLQVCLLHNMPAHKSYPCTDLRWVFPP